MSGLDSSARGESPIRTKLMELKASGCNILVTGEVDTRVTAKMARYTLGEADLERKRILAFANGDDIPFTNYLPDGIRITDEAVTIVDKQNARGATSVNASSMSQSRLSSFKDDIQDAIAGYEDQDPGVIRGAIYSLDILLDEVGLEGVKQFVSQLQTTFYEVDGMGYYYLSRPDENAIVDDLAALFDARIELRQFADGTAAHRWHFSNIDKTTDWYPIKDR